MLKHLLNNHLVCVVKVLFIHLFDEYTMVLHVWLKIHTSKIRHHHKNVVFITIIHLSPLQPFERTLCAKSQSL